MEEGDLLVCSPWFAQFVLLQDHQPRGGTARSDLGPPTSLINQENGPQACPHADLMEAFSQVRSLFPNDSNLCQGDTVLTRMASFPFVHSSQHPTICK